MEREEHPGKGWRVECGYILSCQGSYLGIKRDLRQGILGSRPGGEWKIFMISVGFGLVFVTSVSLSVSLESLMESSNIHCGHPSLNYYG